MSEEYLGGFDDMYLIVRYQAHIMYKKNSGLIPIEDLIDAGHQGVNYALKYYDSSRGMSWRGYATTFIRQRMIQYIKRLYDKKAFFDNIDDHLDLHDELAEIKQEKQENKEYVWRLLKQCDSPPKHKGAMRLWLSGMAIKDIGVTMKVSRERARQFVKETTNAMKAIYRKECRKEVNV